MAGNVGLPSVPRGLSRELSAFLSALTEQVRILAGATRGAGDSRALRASEAVTLSTGGSFIGQGAVGTDNLKPKSITSEKLADGCITEEKLAMGAVQGRAIAVDAVTSDKLKAKAVCRDKLAEDVLPVFVEGKAIDGLRVVLPGAWRERPRVAMLFLEATSPEGAAGPSGLREVQDDKGRETGTWEFLPVGTFTWLCIGWQK